jgi:hypothetical protein
MIRRPVNCVRAMAKAAIEQATTANTADSVAITKLFRYQVWMFPMLNSSW